MLCIGKLFLNFLKNNVFTLLTPSRRSSSVHSPSIHSRIDRVGGEVLPAPLRASGGGGGCGGGASVYGGDDGG